MSCRPRFPWTLLAGAVVSSLIVAACSREGEPEAEQPALAPAVPAGVTAATEVPGEAEAGESGEGQARPSATIGLVNLAPAPALDLAAGGFVDSIADCTSVDVEVIERNAEGDIPSLPVLIERLLDRRVDLVATITTPAAQAAYEVVGEAGGTTPVVYSVVTDPFAAGLALDPATHEPWITGSQSLPPFAAVIDAAQEIVPDLVVMGVIYNPSEANSQVVVNALEGIAAERGLTVALETVEASSEVGEASEALIERGIDAFVVPTDTTVVSGMAPMVEAANENDLLVIGTDAHAAADGAAVGLGTDYYGSGFRGGGIACRVLGGEATPADFDVVNIESLGIAINESSVQAQNITVPQHLRDLAEIME